MKAVSKMRDWQKDWELCQRATPGPWVPSNNGRIYCPKGYYVATVYKLLTPDGLHDTATTNANMQFISEAREALPYWLKWVRKLTACLEDMLCACRDAGPAASQFPESECRALLREIDQVWCRVQRELKEVRK